MAFCITVTSVVIRVTRDEEENRSRLEKAKLWSFSYSASRRPGPVRTAAKASGSGFSPFTR